jgi:hypothetical protein
MRHVCACLLLTVLAHPAGGTELIYQSAREVPVVRQVDVIVTGGTLGAVAAATQAAREGVKVLLVGARPYLGEEINATMRLWLEEGERPQGELTKRVFCGQQTTTPMRVKQVLEAALLEAGADFLLCCYPTDLLVDGSGAPAGIVMANRAGRQAVIGKVIIDATERAVVARLAGAKRRPWVSGPQSCRRIVLGGKPGRSAIPAREMPAGIAVEGEELFYYEYTLDLDLDDGSFGALAQAEHRARDVTYREGQFRSAERLSFVPPDSIIGESAPAGSRADVQATHASPLQQFTPLCARRLRRHPARPGPSVSAPGQFREDRTYGRRGGRPAGKAVEYPGQHHGKD